jgi:hypothetical protein
MFYLIFRTQTLNSGQTQEMAPELQKRRVREEKPNPVKQSAIGIEDAQNQVTS